MPLSPESSVKLTYEDYLLFPDDGQRHELIDGVHYVSPAPALYHQLVSGRLHGELYQLVAKAKLGNVYSAPTDVELGRHDIVQPDLVIVSAARKEILTDSRVLGAPDLVVEVLSPSTGARDRAQKLRAYERTGVAEYWIVDPKLRVIDQYGLEQRKYAHLGRFDATITSKSFPTVTLDLHEIW